MSFPMSNNPYEAPQADGFGLVGVPQIPPGFFGKLLMGLWLLFGNVTNIGPIVLTVWLPAHLLIESVMAQSLEPNDVLTSIKLNNLVSAFFDPLVAAAILWVLSERMEGRRVNYLSAMSVGLQNWPRLFGARFVSGIFIILGLIALIVPGIILAIRYSLLDEAVVLEGQNIRAARSRSTSLVASSKGLIFLSCLVCFSSLMAVAIGLGLLVETIPALNNLAGNVGVQCLINVMSTHQACVLFLYYWELKGMERHSFDGEPSQNVDIDGIG